MLRGSAASVVVMAAAFTCAVSCDGSDAPTMREPVPSGTVATAPDIHPGTAGGVAAGPSDDGCNRPPPTTWLERGPIHTIAMSSDPVSVEVSIDPRTICSGGSTKVTFMFVNDGASTLTVGTPSIVMSGCCIDKWDLGTLPDVRIGSGASITLSTTVAVPSVAPGEYHVGIYGYASSGDPLVLEAPRGDPVQAGATLLIDASGVPGAGHRLRDAMLSLHASCPTAAIGIRNVDVVEASRRSGVSKTLYMAVESSAAYPLAVFLRVAAEAEQASDWTDAAYAVNYAQAIVLGADFERLMTRILDAHDVPCVTVEPIPLTTVTTLPLADGPDESARAARSAPRHLQSPTMT